MKRNILIYNFLESIGFRLTKKDTSSFFGDYYDIFNYLDLQLRFSQSKSFESIDVRKNLSGEEWYDLALVKALLYDETVVNKVTTVEEYSAFLEKEINSIVELFEDKDYPNTKKRLYELGIERVKQMFPGINI